MSQTAETNEISSLVGVLVDGARQYEFQQHVYTAGAARTGGYLSAFADAGSVSD